MKAKSLNQSIELDELLFIAKFRNGEDNRIRHYYSETLYQKKDGSFILQCFGKPLCKHAQIDGIDRHEQTYFTEVDPLEWLIEHDHEHLAGFLFPNYQKQIVDALNDLNLQSSSVDDNSFYGLRFKNKMTRNALERNCILANAQLGFDNFFKVNPDVDGIIMLPGFENYDDEKWDYFEKVQGNSFTGDYSIIFPEADGDTLVPEEFYGSVDLLIKYYNIATAPDERYE